MTNGTGAWTKLTSGLGTSGMYTWSHLKGFRRIGASPAVEDVAAVLAAAQSALGSAAHHRMRPSGPDGEALTSPLDLQAWLLDECPEPTGVEDLEAAPDPKFATW